MHFGVKAGVAPTQLTLEQLPEQAMKPLAVTWRARGGDHESAPFEVGDDVVGVGPRQPVAEVGVEHSGDRAGSPRLFAVAGQQHVEHLGDDVVGEEAVRWQEGVRAGAWVGRLGGGDERQVQTDRPPFDVAVERDDGVGRDAAFERRRGCQRLVVGEAEIVLTNVDEPSVGTPASERQWWVGTGADDEPQQVPSRRSTSTLIPSWMRLLAHRATSSTTSVKGRGGTLNLGDEDGEEPLTLAVLAQHQLGLVVHLGNDLAYRSDDVEPERDGAFVGRVERDPVQTG